MITECDSFADEVALHESYAADYAEAHSSLITYRVVYVTVDGTQYEIDACGTEDPAGIASACVFDLPNSAWREDYNDALAVVYERVTGDVTVCRLSDNGDRFCATAVLDDGMNAVSMNVVGNDE